MRSIRLAACVLLPAFALGCSDRSAGGGAGENGGTLVITTPGGASSFIAPLAIDATSREVADMLYERLAELGPDLNTIGDRGFQPALARAWTFSPDSLAIAFALDPAAKWHDGRPVRANDVRFSFVLLKNPAFGSPATPLIANIDSVTVRDSLTAVAWFRRRSPEQLYDMVYQVYILPEHLLKDIPADKIGTSEFALQRPVGSGRFRFVRHEPGVRIEVVADTAHYRARAKLDRIIWSLTSDANASITQLLSGQADFYDAVPADVLPRLDSAGSVRGMRYPNMQPSYMHLNLRHPTRRSAPHPVFGDVRVRRAVSMALDRQAMLRNVFDTLGTLGTGPLARSIGDTTVVLPPFDRARAAALLDSAGWRAGADGMRSRNGAPLAFKLLVPTSSRPRMRYAVLIQEQLKAVGARVDIESMDFSAFITRQNARNFDAAMIAVITDPARSGLTQYWASASPDNYGNYSNPRFNATLDSALHTFDEPTMVARFHRALQILADDAPAVWLYDVLTIAGVHKRFRPTDLRASAWWHGLADWTVPTNERIDRDRIGLRPAQP